MTIERVERFSDPEWDRAVFQHAEATLFHGRAWARFLREVFPALEDRSVWLRENGRDLLLPLFAWRRAGGALTTLHSAFPFLYGGFVPARDALPWSAVKLGGAFRLTGNPFAEIETALPSADRRAERTHVLTLPATIDAYWNEVLSTGKRNDVRRLGKKGVEITESRDPNDVRAVYALYLASFERWGGRPGFVYPESYYARLLTSLEGAARLSVARHEGRLLGGAFTVRANGIVHYLAGYFEPEARALRPNVLLQIESIQHAIESGARLYDFLPSGGHASVEQFKEGLGGVRREFAVYERLSPLRRWIDRARGRRREREDSSDGEQG